MTLIIRPSEDQAEQPEHLARHTVEVETARDDVSVSTLVQMFKCALLAAEFPAAVVARIEFKPGKARE